MTQYRKQLQSKPSDLDFDELNQVKREVDFFVKHRKQESQERAQKKLKLKQKLESPQVFYSNLNQTANLDLKYNSHSKLISFKHNERKGDRLLSRTLQRTTQQVSSKKPLNLT